MSEYRIQGASGEWEVVIGLEVHAQVTSNAKLFSGAATAFGAEPNTQVSLVDAAMPGMLPVPNMECIRQAVRTGMTGGSENGGVAGVDGMLEPEAVGDAVVRGLFDETFWILPHPSVAEYVRRKASDVDRWLAGMRRLQARFLPDGLPG